MYRTLLESLIADSYIAPNRTLYVISDSQLDELKRKQRQGELDDIEASRQRLEESYRSRIKILDDRLSQLQEEHKPVTPSKK